MLIQFESLHNGFNYLIIMIIVTLSKVIKHLDVEGDLVYKVKWKKQTFLPSLSEWIRN